MKIAILGSHPQTKWQAPFDDESWKIWACSPHNFEHGILPRVDEWFEVHPTAFCPDTRQAPYMEYVRELTEKIPVWMQDRSGHPKARQYPEEELKKVFSPFHFTSSIAYIMAKAIAEKPKEIGLWGIMQKAQTEYQYQKPGIQYFFKVAHDAGIDVTVPEVSKLFQAPDDIW